MTKKTQKLLDVLAIKYGPGDSLSSRYAFISEVRAGTGFGRESRADAIVYSLWPSNGLEMIGFELKTSRADWLREIKTNGLKADPIKQFCDRWYLVTHWDSEQTIVRDPASEIPEDWGWMEYYYDGKLHVRKEAPKLDPKPFDRPFIASIFRIASKQLDEVVINGRTYQVKP